MGLAGHVDGIRKSRTVVCLWSSLSCAISRQENGNLGSAENEHTCCVSKGILYNVTLLLFVFTF